MKGDYRRAIEDYNEAIAIAPERAVYHRSLGLARFYNGNYQGAEADFRRALEFGNDSYSMIFLFLSRARQGQEERARGELLAAAAKLTSREWPYAAIELLAGAQSRQAELPAIDKRNEVCEANYYTGHHAWLRKDMAAARRYFELAEQNCPKTIFEYAAAKAELKRLP